LAKFPVFIFSPDRHGCWNDLYLSAYCAKLLGENFQGGSSKTKKRWKVKKQSQLERLWWSKDTDEVWSTYCRECAIKFGETQGLVVAIDPLRQTTVKPEYMLTPLGTPRPANEEIEPEVYEALPYDTEFDYPVSCENFECGLWLECSLTKDGWNYLTDKTNGFPKWLIALHKGE